MGVWRLIQRKLLSGCRFLERLTPFHMAATVK